MKTAYSSSEDVAEFKNLETTPTDQIACTMRLRADLIPGMLVAIWFGVFCLPD
jgi:F0F1-type ATP synthase assembly protein I